MSNHQILFTPYVCSLLLLWGTGCANSNYGQLIKKFSRAGESATVSNSRAAISNAIVLWSGTLTNGYVFYNDREARLKNVTLTNDPATIFLLRNGTNAIGYWGKSACLSAGNSSYWADVIIRVLPVTGGNRISVAIHGGHFVKGLVWNFHTYGFEHEKEVDLPPCPQDERQMLDEILSTLRKGVGS